MSNIVFNAALPGIDLSSTDIFGQLFGLDIMTRSSTRLTLIDEGDRYNFIGSGLTYEMSGARIVGIPTGTVTQMTITYGAATLLNWSGFSVSANEMFTFAALGNWRGLDRLLLGQADTISMTNGDDQINSGGGSDIVKLLQGNDLAAGQGGADTLDGGAGQDSLLGGDGNDHLIGGMGLDRLSGEAGRDVFLFTHLGRGHRDIITDFNARQDDLHFDHDVFDAVDAAGGLAADQFVQGTVARDANDVFIYQRSTGNLWYDADGSGRGTKVLVAELRDGTALGAGDIHIL